MTEGEDVDVDEEVEGSVTTTSQVRWKHLSSSVTILVTLAYITLTLGQLYAPALGVELGTVDPGAWATFSLAFLGVMAYSVGVDTLRGVAELRGK